MRDRSALFLHDCNTTLHLLSSVNFPGLIVNRRYVYPIMLFAFTDEVDVCDMSNRFFSLRFRSEGGGVQSLDDPL